MPKMSNMHTIFNYLYMYMLSPTHIINILELFDL